MSFSDIIGHKNIISYLIEAADNKRLSPAYLFIGPDGVGKKTTALNLAKYLNCESLNQKPCDLCPSCKRIDSGNHPDVTVLTPSGKSGIINIDSIRDIRTNAYLKPYESKYKIFVLDNAEGLNQEASNSLLKVLEECPEGNIFILISTSAELLLPTITSRSQLLKFSVTAQNDVTDLLIKKYGVENQKAQMITKLSGGRVGFAVEMINTDISIRKNEVIDSVQDVIMNNNLSGFKDWEKDDRPSFSEEMLYILSWFRDILLYKVSQDDKLMINYDRINEIKKMKDKISFDRLEGLMDKLIKLNTYVDANVNMKLIADALLCEIGNLKG